MIDPQLMLGTAALGALGAVLALYLTRPPLSHDRKTKLLWEEYMMSLVNIGVVVFFEGGEADAELPEAFLRERVAKVVMANPWLLAQRNLLFRQMTWASRVEHEEAARSFRVLQGFRDISPDTPPTELHQRLKEHIQYSVFGDLFRVLAFRTNKGFALLFIMCHGYADGNTFYTLLNMISDGAEVKSLDPQRATSFDKNRDMLAPKGTLHFETLPGCLVTGVRWMMSQLAPVFPAFRQVYSRYRIRPEYVEQCKKEVSEGFVSTNDVVTSWVMQAWHGQYRYMAVNARGRVHGCRFDQAGHYTLTLALPASADVSPEGIRKALSPNRPVTAPPSLWDPLWCKPVIVTNWSSFYKPLEVPGFKEVHHQPCGYMEGFRLCVIFRPRPNELAVMMHPLVEEAPISFKPEGILDTL